MLYITKIDVKLHLFFPKLMLIKYDEKILVFCKQKKIVAKTKIKNALKCIEFNFTKQNSLTFLNMSNPRPIEHIPRKAASKASVIVDW